MPHRRRLIQPLLQADIPGSQLPDRVLGFVRQEELFRGGDRVLVAVSGGPDSVALLHLLAGWRQELGLELAVGHFDHGLRRESQEEADWVESLAAQLKLPMHQGRGAVKELARTSRLSLQMAARKLRLSLSAGGLRGSWLSKAGPGPHRRRSGGTLLSAAAAGRRPRGFEGHVARHPRRRRPAALGGGQGASARLVGGAGHPLPPGPQQPEPRLPAQPGPPGPAAGVVAPLQPPPPGGGLARPGAASGG